jgi:hypothetical protein
MQGRAVAVPAGAVRRALWIEEAFFTRGIV